MHRHNMLHLRSAAILLTSILLFSIAGIASAATARPPDATGRQVNSVQRYAVQQLFQTAQEKARTAKTSQAKEALAATAKTLLTNALDAMIENVQTLQTKVRQIHGIAESDRTALSAELQPDLAWLTEQRARAVTLTPGQIKPRTNDIRIRWSVIRADLTRVTGELHAARIYYLITAMKNNSDKIDRNVQTHTKAGMDTGKLQILLATYNNRMAAATAQYNLSLPVFRQIRSAADMQQLFQRGTAFLHTAQQAVRDGQTALGSIVTEMRGLQKK